MKTYKDIIAEVAQPVSDGEKRFKDKHIVHKIDHPVADDDQFTSGKIKKDKTKLASHHEDEDEEVYEAAMSAADMKQREGIVKGMKKNKDDLKARYGDKWKSVMYATATKKALEEASTEELDEALDSVDPKAVKKKFDDRKDKDIDNDGDVDSSDEYLHKRRKAISKTLKKEEVDTSDAKKSDLEETFKKGDIVKPKKGPHANQPHEVIHDFGDGHYNIKPTKLSAKQIKYSLGAARAHKSELVKEEVELDEARWEYKGDKTYMVGSNLSYDDKMEYKLSKANADILNRYMKQAKSDAERSKVWNMFWGSKETGNTAKGPEMAIAYAKKTIKEEVELDEAPRRKGAPKIKPDFLKVQRAKDAEHNAAMGRTKTGRKKPERRMTSTQRSMASMKKEEVELDEAFKAGAVKLSDGSSVKLTNEDVTALNSLFSELTTSNQKKMQERLMKDKKGFSEIVSFAKEAL